MLSRQSAITAVLGDDFEQLKHLISITNYLPVYLRESQATPMPLRDINDQNWLIFVQEYRRSFYLEIQFRKYFVDYLLQEIGDTKRFFSECACYRDGVLTGYADNCILINKKLCFVEVKLNVKTVHKIENQLEKYCYLSEIILGKKKYDSINLIQNRIIVIDTEKIYYFDAETENLVDIIDLDILKNKEDLKKVKNMIIHCIAS